MNITTRLTKTLLSTSIAAALALASASAIAQEDSTAMKTYTDPVSGELKVAPKLLSEMTEEEKAALSNEEVKYLQEIEGLVMKEQNRTEQ